MTQGLISGNVTINGRRTSLRLQNEIWEAIAEVCAHEELTVHQLCSLIDGRRGIFSRISAIRAFIVAYLRDASTNVRYLKAWHRKLGLEVASKPKEKRIETFSKLDKAA